MKEARNASAPLHINRNPDNSFWFKSELTDWMPKRTVFRSQTREYRGEKKAFRRMNAAIKSTEKVFWV